MAETEYQRRQTEERAALDKLADEIAAELGDWRANRDPDHWGVTLTKYKGSGELFLAFDRGAPDAKRRDRVVVSGHYPRGAHDLVRYGAESDHDRRTVRRWEITVATSRGVETIVKEIRRRLIPGYLADLAAVHGWMTEHDDHRAAALAAGQEIATILGTTASMDDRDTEARVSYYRAGQTVGGYGDLRVSANYVRFDRLSVTVEQARRIAEILAEH